MAVTFPGASVLVLVAAGVCLAQTGAPTAVQPDDPRDLLEQVSAAERSAAGRHAEGVEINELTGEGMNIRTQQRFSATVKDATRLRWQIDGEPSTLTVCDGTEHWSYTQPGVGFHISPVEATPCPSPLPQFDNLVENLATVVAMGTETVLFEGESASCTVVRADYRIPVVSRGASVGTGAIGAAMIRTMCIDAARKLVLRDKAENWNSGSNARSVRTTTFSAYERDPEIPAAAFVFEVPTGTYLDPGPQAGESSGQAADGSHRFGDGVISPVLVVRNNPLPTGEAYAAGVGGLVLVSLTVDAEGMPRDVAVERRLGYGLDEKAVEAVSRWRFKPGLSFGMPVAVRDLVVAVDFPRP